jgi:predicted nucleotidyltransferase component of viral defense system
VASFSLLKKTDLKLLTDKAIELSCNISYLEKDYYAVQLIKCLQAFTVENGSFIFTGGTALAKGYKLIDRFSEDCDFIFLKEETNRSQRSGIKEKIHSYLIQEGFKIEKEPGSSNESKNWLFEIEYERLSHEDNNLRPELRLEIVHKEQIKIKDLPKKPIQSFLAEAKNDIPEIVGMNCLSVEEICAGKLSALIWRYCLEESKVREPQKIRHLYDIATLTQTLSNSPLFKDVFNCVVMEDLEERTNLPLKLPEALKRSLQQLRNNPEHRDNYQNYVKNYIYDPFNNQLSFEEAVERLKALVESVLVDQATSL